MQPLSFGALTLLMLDSDISHISWIPSTAVGHPVLLKYLGHSDTYNFDLYLVCQCSLSLNCLCHVLSS